MSTLQHTATHCNVPVSFPSLGWKTWAQWFMFLLLSLSLPPPLSVAISIPSTKPKEHTQTEKHYNTHCNSFCSKSALENLSASISLSPSPSPFFFPSLALSLSVSLSHCVYSKSDLENLSAADQRTCICCPKEHTATHCNTLQHTATHCNMQHIITHQSLLRVRSRKPERSGPEAALHLLTKKTYCNTLQRTATYSNILQQSAKHCNTL